MRLSPLHVGCGVKRSPVRQDKVKKGTFYFHPDHIGSISYLTDSNGEVVTRMSYTPYGEKVKSASTGPDIFHQKYTGQVDDGEEAELLYYNARYYDPKLGRFISADSTIPDPGSTQAFNRYMYVLGNPVSFNDPTGHWDNDPRESAINQVNAMINGNYSGSVTSCDSDGNCETWSYNHETQMVVGWTFKNNNLCGDPSNNYGTTSPSSNGHGGDLHSKNNYGIGLKSAINADWGADYKQASYAAYRNKDYYNAGLNAAASFSEFAYDSLAVASGIGLVARLVSGVTAGGGAVAVAEGGGLLNPSINITQRGWNHVFNRHISNSSFIEKSKFALNVDVKQLIQRATQMTMIKQENGNFARVVDAGTVIGIDRTTGLATSIYTVITNARGDLITTFPGLP